jgi:hypothetical protein
MVVLQGAHCSFLEISFIRTTLIPNRMNEQSICKFVNSTVLGDVAETAFIANYANVILNLSIPTF